MNIILLTALCGLSAFLLSVSGQTPMEWRLEGLAAHNAYRKKYYESPPLQLGDDKLCGYSQDWVDKLSNGEVKGHSPGNQYGENIWSGTSKNVPNATTVVGRWYSEISDYFPEDRVSSRLKMTGHYTAVVWAKTQFVCMSYAIGKGEIWTNVVANYFPPGNNRKPERHQQNIKFPKGADGRFLAETDKQYPLPSASERRRKLGELGSSAQVEDPVPEKGASGPDKSAPSEAGPQPEKAIPREGSAQDKSTPDAKREPEKSPTQERKPESGKVPPPETKEKPDKISPPDTAHGPEAGRSLEGSPALNTSPAPVTSGSGTGKPASSPISSANTPTKKRVKKKRKKINHRRSRSLLQTRTTTTTAAPDEADPADYEKAEGIATDDGVILPADFDKLQKNPALGNTTKIDKPNVPKTDKVDKPNIPKTDKVDNPNVPKTDKVDKPNVPKTAKVDKPNVPKTDKVEKPNVPNTDKIDKPNVPKADKVGEPNIAKTDKVDKQNVTKTDKVDKPNVPKTDKVDKANVPKTDQVDKSGLGRSKKVDKPNLDNSDTVSKPTETKPSVPEVGGLGR